MTFAGGSCPTTLASTPLALTPPNCTPGEEAEEVREASEVGVDAEVGGARAEAEELVYTERPLGSLCSSRTARFP